MLHDDLHHEGDLGVVHALVADKHLHSCFPAFLLSPESRVEHQTLRQANALVADQWGQD